MSRDHFTSGPRHHGQRRWLLPILCLATLYAAPQGLSAADNKEVQAPKENAESSKATPSPSAGKPDSAAPTVDAKGKTSNLTIIVSGGKKPRKQTEVRVTPAPQPGGTKTKEITGHTNDDGKYVFSELPVGEVDVLVLPTGPWRTKRQRIPLKAGDHTLKIELEPL